jgi:hypothetical protein
VKDGSDNFGPWAEGCSPAEQLARLRSLRTIAMLMFGARVPVAKPLFLAESLDAGEMADALAAVNAMRTLDRRKLLASYMQINLMMTRDAA